MRPIQKDILKRLNILPTKRLGQNFLIDEGVAEKILNEADIDKGDIVVEVGPGFGVLTLPLSKRAANVIAIEKDRRLAAYLIEKNIGNVEIIHGDALRVSYKDIFNKQKKRLKLVSNLPYSISTPLIFKLLDERDVFESFFIMLQKEVAQRLAAAPCTKAYGILSVMVQLLTDVSIVGDVPPKAFYPRPKVNSSLVKLRIPDRPRVQIKDLKLFRRLVGNCFGQRRKTLKNALKAALGESAKEILNDAGIDSGRRGETLSLEEFKLLYDSYLKIIN